MANYTATQPTKERNATMNRVEDAAHDAAGSLRAAAEDAGGRVRQFLHDTTDQAADLRRTAEEKISDNPMKSVAIAAIAGLLFGALLRR